MGLPGYRSHGDQQLVPVRLPHGLRVDRLGGPLPPGPDPEDRPPISGPPRALLILVPGGRLKRFFTAICPRVGLARRRWATCVAATIFITFF